MQCPQNDSALMRTNLILDATERLVEDQGIVSFKVSQVINESGCANASFYKLFESKEDLIVCCFLRNATSNHFQDFMVANPNLSSLDKVLLPIMFTFETLYFSPVFNIIRQVAVNRLVWALASPEKGKLIENRVNLFWQWIHKFIEDAVANKDLVANESQIFEMTQGITFYLTGALNAFQSQLIQGEFLKEARLTMFRHLELLFDHYNWITPLTFSQFERIGMKVHIYYHKNQSDRNSCQRCQLQQQKYIGDKMAQNSLK
ncbi:TetR/AcrR family transcriptional regulator [Shewanella donghaensis]|uniref:TetR/AcrR family transcriptional regulator n=1 Tax=Shewanella donghaensis TaxID=238836 RepID=UPI00118370D3|nr:TetR/AcrR family transcriptional regulator [Shewanella donghaensis]